VSSTTRSSVALMAAVALHGGALGLAFWAPAPKTEELVLPTVQGILLPAPPAEIVQAPTPPEPAPPPPEPKPEKPKPKPKAPPQPKPPIEQPPSERAISQPEEVMETPPPAQAALPVTESKETLGPPVTPPVDANALNNPRPTYPNLSRRLGEKGIVLLEILILADGTVGEVRIKESSGYKRLDDTAVKAVKRWRYTPAKRGGEAIDYWYLQPVDFSLH
jgi:protein TonB